MAGKVATSKISLACPTCGSSNVFYSCTPNCCFNHVCSDCGTTFEPVTVASGGRLGSIVPPDPLPDATDPTVACAACDSTDVYAIAVGQAVCAKCGTLLRIEMTEIAPGS
jgi:DNA-directed RNA polymerase subunit RPC12/RpoP